MSQLKSFTTHLGDLFEEELDTNKGVGVFRGRVILDGFGELLGGFHVLSPPLEQRLAL